ncbi:helix-turn-helix domain-containing protein [Nocardioides okcheonensis]|uniref:helix-turn-helix domain-containing protein n=1 Tax=Nocardioides okcheonensis TaxID=2894081 RepID=UPI0038B2B1E4
MDLDELLGIDSRSALSRRARRMVEGDRGLIRALREIRESKGMSQQDVADRMQVSQSAVAKIESGERDPRLSTIRRYAMAVGAVVLHDAKDDEKPVPMTQGGQHMDVSWPEDNHVVPNRRSLAKA